MQQAAPYFLGRGAAVLLVDATSHRLPLLLSPKLCAVLDTLLGHGVLTGLQFALGSALGGGAAQARELGLLCGLVSVGMDADHFLAAGSLSMRAAMTLPSRPFAHSVAFRLLALALAAALAHRLLPPWAPHLLLCAFGGHQLRDSLKHGLWLGPAALGSTPPTPYALYVLLMAGAPLALAGPLRAVYQPPPLLPLTNPL